MSRNRKKKLLFVINILDTGGVQTFILNLATQLSSTYKVYILHLYPWHINKAFVEQKIDTQQVKLLSFPRFLDKILWWFDGRIESFLSKPKSFLYTPVRAFLDKVFMRSIIQFLDINLIQSHGMCADRYIYNSLKKIQIPLLIRMHGSYDQNFDGGAEQRIGFENFLLQAKLYLNSAMKIIYCADKNKWIKTQVEIKIPFKKIHNGYPSFSKVEKRPQVFTFGMVARGAKAKGWECLIKAFIKLNEEFSNVKLQLAYSETKNILILKKKYEGYQSIDFIGQVNDVEKFLQNIHVGVLPTEDDCLPNTIIEYLNSGIPAISTIVGDIPEMLKTSNNELAGQLIPLETDGKPSVEKLYLAMRAYLEDETLYKHHCELAIDAFQKFDMETCAKKYMEVYEELIEEKKKQLKK